MPLLALASHYWAERYIAEALLSPLGEITQVFWIVSEIIPSKNAVNPFRGTPRIQL
jgi:hypothetical protein